MRRDFEVGEKKMESLGERGGVELDSVWTRTRSDLLAWELGRRERDVLGEAKVVHGSQLHPWEICKLRYERAVAEAINRARISGGRDS